MRHTRPSASFVREFLCLLLSTVLIAAPALALPLPQAKPVNAPPSTVSFKALLRTWMPGLFLSRYARGATLQNGTTPNLDTLRVSSPQPPDAYTQGSLPAASYLDPTPLNGANVNTYFTQLTEPGNPSGPIGALPMQAPDPTAGASVVGGLSVDMITRHFNWSAPVMGLAGRAGLGVGLGLSYSSNVWINGAYNIDRGFPGPGWRFGFGSILPPNGNYGYTNQTTNGWSVMYLAPDGTRHTLKHNPTTDNYESYDSTYLSYNNNTSVLTTTNGTRFYFGAVSTSALSRDFQSYVTKITDRNGNYLNISYKTLSNQAMVPDYVTDTAGRRIDFEYTNNRLTGVKQLRGGNTVYSVRIDYTAITMQVDANSDPPLNGAQVWLPSKLTYPTGVNLRFSYNAQGVMTNIEKWVPAISSQGAAARAVAGCSLAAGMAWRSEWAENWQGGAVQNYNYTGTTAGGWAVTDPGGRKFATHINGMVYESSIAQGWASGATKVTYLTYAQDAGLSYRSNPRLVTSLIADVLNSNLTRRTDVNYTPAHGVWLPSETIEYGGGIYRKTVTSYLHHSAQRIIGLPHKVAVYNAANVKLAESENVYDETGNYTDSNNQAASYFINATVGNVIQHDDANYGFNFTARGNLTRTLQYNGGTGTGGARHEIHQLRHERECEGDGGWREKSVAN